MASAAVHHSGMASNLEPPGITSSFTARRSAASNLPNFELPPPQQLSHKYLPFSSMNANQPTAAMVNVGNLLTPPSNIPGDSLSPISSGVNSVGPASQGLPPYTPNTYWAPPTTGGNTFTMGTGTTPQPWGQGTLNPLFPPRGMFSPSLGSLVRNSSHSPSASDGLPPPPYDLPPFSASMSMSAPASLPAIAAQQQQAIAHYMNVQNPISGSATQTSPVNGSDSYAQRPSSTPAYYAHSQPSSASQQGQFPSFHNSPPGQQSPMSAIPQGSRLSPINGQPPNLQPAPSQQGNRFVPPYPSYSLPAVGGPIMSNVLNPNSPMALVGMSNHGMPGMMPGFNSGHSAQMQQMYGAPPQTPHNERPFKCDQCPQSFNRNHDLKRHKRIHLAVKPFPCGHCEKSFSRKDALKRHILVKGCGKGGANSVGKDRDSMSPVDKSENLSSDNDDSAIMSN